MRNTRYRPRGLARSSATPEGTRSLNATIRRPENTATTVRARLDATIAKRVGPSQATRLVRHPDVPRSAGRRSSAPASWLSLRRISARPVRGNWTIAPRRTYVIEPSGLHAGAQPPIIGSDGPAAALTMTCRCSQRAASGVLRGQSDQPGGADAGEMSARQPPSRGARAAARDGRRSACNRQAESTK